MRGTKDLARFPICFVPCVKITVSFHSWRNLKTASGSGVRVDAAVPVTITDRKSGQQSTGFLKSKGKQLKTTGIASFMEKDIGMHDECKDDSDVWAKKFAMDTVLTGCQKMVSQRASLTFYETVMKGVKGYHNTALGHVSINGKKIKAQPKIKLNDNNIATLQHAVCDVFTESTDSPNGALRKPYGKYYSIMHDGIQKFSRELNGVFIRTVQLDDDGVKIINIPWKLSEIPGGSLNATKLVTHLLKTIASVKIPTKNAFDSFIQAQKNAGISDLESEFPPEFFKCCEIEHCDLDINSISLVFNEWPVVLMADGCYTNNSASTALTNMFGFMSPSARCSSHAADGSVKRMSKSQTYSVEEVKVFVEHYRPILRHYQMSSRSTCILNNALQAMDMKQVHLMTWCPTRMSNLLTCAVQTVKNLFPLCDVLVTCDIKVDDRDYFMSPKGLILVHLLADLEQVFVPQLLGKVDRDQSMMIEVFGASQKFLTRLDDFQIPLTDSFVDGLRFDDFGNILYEK